MSIDPRPDTRTGHDHARVRAHDVGAASTIALVARREMLAQVRKKSFVVSNVIVLVAIVAGIVLMSRVGGEDATTIAVVGDGEFTTVVDDTATGAGVDLDVRSVADEREGRESVRSGALDVLAVHHDDGSVVVVTESELDPAIDGVLRTAAAVAAQQRALTAAGVDPAELAQATGQAEVTVDALDPPDPDAAQRTTVAYITVFLLYFQIMLFGMYVAMGVVEEKSSRVVELLLATVKPLHLLWGKVLGIGIVGLAQLAAYGVVGVVTAVSTGVLTISGTAYGTLAVALGWFVLGFVFFAMLYAAAGSMVSRQEDVNSTTMPITILIMAMFFAAIGALGRPDASWVEILAWIPPFSAILMPLRVASGTATGVQVAGTIVLMIVATVALSFLASRIYRRSVLRTGKVVSWKAALRG